MAFALLQTLCEGRGNKRHIAASKTPLGQSRSSSRSSQPGYSSATGQEECVANFVELAIELASVSAVEY